MPPRFKTHSEFIQEICAISPKIEILGEYVASKTKIKCRCKIDGYEWETMPNKLIQKRGCPKCRSNGNSERLKKTHNKFIDEVREKCPDIEVIGEYKRSNKKILFRCKIDGYEWETAPANILMGTGCPKCANRPRYDTASFLEKISTLNPNIDVCGEYLNNQSKMRCKCKIDGYEWTTSANGLMSGKGCHKCAHKNTKDRQLISHNKFTQRVKFGSPNLKITSQYVGMNKAVSALCTSCGHLWITYAKVLVSGHGCPNCNISNGEKKVFDYLKDRQIDFIQQQKFKDCKYKKCLPFDFYLPSMNLVIEYDGIQHYKPIERFGGEDQFKLQVCKDKIKSEYCANKNIKLLRIPYFEINVEQYLKTNLAI